MKGIYIVQFDIYPGLYKIGKSKDIDARFKSFKDNTVILGNVDLLYSKEFEDINKAEKDIHTLLKEYRYKKNREFFKGDLQIFIETINTLNPNDYKLPIKDNTPHVLLSSPLPEGQFYESDMVQFKHLKVVMDNLMSAANIIGKITDRVLEQEQRIDDQEERIQQLQEMNDILIAKVKNLK